MKFSVVVNTFQDMYPMFGVDKDIYRFLFDEMKRQTCHDFELIIVDRMFHERKHMFSNLRLPFPFKYIPPKPTPWAEIGGTTISSDRNSGITIAQGEFTVCLDDCVFPVNAEYLDQVWEWYQKDIILRPLCYNYDYSTTPVSVNPDPVATWVADNFPLEPGEEKEVEPHQVSGNCPRCYQLPTECFEILNGFDENFDGGRGSEDSNFWERFTAAGLKHYVLKYGTQHHLGTVHHHHEMYKTINTYFRCNYAYAFWTYKYVQESKDFRTNEKILDRQDVAQIRSMCNNCPHRTGLCWKNDEDPIGSEFYLKIQPRFNLKQIRARNIEIFGSKNGVLDPWQSEG